MTDATGHVLRPGEGHQYEARGSRMFFKAIADETSGDFSLMERLLPPGGRRPPPHRHTNCSEAYFVLDGLVEVSVDGEDRVLTPGDFVLVPRGTAHTFGNSCDRESRLLVLHAPAMDRYFAQLHELWGQDSPPTTEDERALMSRFGMTPA